MIKKCENKSIVVTKCGRLLLQNASGTTSCDRFYYRVRQVLQSATVITKGGLALSVIRKKSFFSLHNEATLDTGVNINMKKITSFVSLV